MTATISWTLALEASQRAASIAVVDQAGRCETEMLRADRRSDEDLLPAIDRLARRLALAPGGLDAVAVSTGPGGFTGLRVSIAVAKMFGELGATIAAVPSALVAAEAHREDTKATAISLLVALAVKRHGAETTAWCARCVHERADWTMEVLGLLPVERILLECDRIDALLADEHVPVAIRDRATNAGVPCTPPRFTAGACLRVGLAMLEAGRSTDPQALGPIYPRPPEAVTLWEARYGAKD